MGLFDDLVRSALGADAPKAEGKSRGMVEGILDMLQDPALGGVQGVARRFEEKGLGAEVASWIGTGPNRAISPDQLVSALGDRRVDALSQRAGLGKAAGAAVLAAVLPALIDKLTPDGRAPETNRLADLGKSLLGGLFGGSAAAAVARGTESTAGTARQADFSNVQAGSSSTASRQASGAQEAPAQWYTVVAGDSLSRIAKRVYGDANQWRRIFDANRDQIENPDLIHPGQKLQIPTIQKSG